MVQKSNIQKRERKFEYLHIKLYSLTDLYTFNFFSFFPENWKFFLNFFKQIFRNNDLGHLRWKTDSDWKKEHTYHKTQNFVGKKTLFCFENIWVCLQVPKNM